MPRSQAEFSAACKSVLPRLNGLRKDSGSDGMGKMCLFDKLRAGSQGLKSLRENQKKAADIFGPMRDLFCLTYGIQADLRG